MRFSRGTGWVELERGDSIEKAIKVIGHFFKKELVQELKNRVYFLSPSERRRGKSRRSRARKLKAEGKRQEAEGRQEK